MREEAPKTGVVAQHGVKAAKGHLMTGTVDRPRGVGLGTDPLPYLLTEVIGDWLAGHSAQDEPKDLGLGTGVVPSRIRRCDAGIELRDADHRGLAGPAEQVAPEARNIVLPVVGLLEVDTRGHVQQRANRRLTVLG